MIAAGRRRKTVYAPPYRWYYRSGPWSVGAPHGDDSSYLHDPAAGLGAGAAPPDRQAQRGSAGFSGALYPRRRQLHLAPELARFGRLGRWLRELPQLAALLHPRRQPGSLRPQPLPVGGSYTPVCGLWPGLARVRRLLRLDAPRRELDLLLLLR